MNTADFVVHFRENFASRIGRPVLVALSGGRDSVALLHLLRAPELELRLEAAHVHHGLRGAEADADAEFCRRLCRELDIRFEAIRLPPDDGRPATGEAAWRRRRYRALLDHAAARSIPTVATAHHRDDVAEGVLLQLLRGAGPRSMAGIAATTPEGVIRPLLPWGRDEITGWLERHDLEWQDDSSNLDTGRLRNRVRHRILPSLEDDTPHLRSHLVRLAAAIAETEDHLAAELRRRAVFADPWDPDGGVPEATLRALPGALRTRWLHDQAHRLGLGPATRRQLELFHLMLDRSEPRAVTLGGRWRLRTARGRIWAEPPEAPAGTAGELRPGDTIELGIPGWVVCFGPGNDPSPHARWWWRPPAAARSISLRPPRPGDRVAGVAGATRSARKALAGALPRHLRPAWPVFCEGDMIHWIPGVWQHPKPGDPSNRVVEVLRR